MNITSIDTLLLTRLLLAALLGSLIGLEREYRAKEAGLRTHFLVAVGSALFMLISQFGFTAALDNFAQLYPNATELPVRTDLSRVASQIVSGIGFIGAGTIVLHKRFVVGLTTAASIWTTAAIGVAVAGGLYAVAITATILSLAGLELFSFIDRRLGHSRHERTLSFASPSSEDTLLTLELLKANGAQILSYKASATDSAPTTITCSIVVNGKLAPADKLLKLLNQNPKIHVLAIE